MPRRLLARPAARRLPLLAVLLVASGCSGDLEPRPEWRPAVGADAYRALLSAKAGVELDPRELSSLAEADGARLSAAMDALAGRIEPGSDWRGLFERLRADHPPDVEGILALYRAEVDRARELVERLGLLTLPEGRLEVVPTPAGPLERRYPFVAYIGNRLAVTVGEGARLRDHCRACVPPLAVHETYPGHHAAFLLQHAGGGDPEPDALALARRHLKNPFFHEAWGQYAELLMLEQGHYEGRPAHELGAWRSLLFRVTRARLDPLLHLGAVTPERAVEELSLFVDRETARVEVARHLDEPTVKAAYYVGLLQILELRETLRREDPELDLRAFHDRLASLALPIPDAARARFGVETGPGLPEGGLTRFLPSLTAAGGPGKMERR